MGGSDGDRGIPLLGWSAEHGGLRAPHFAGLRALQVLIPFAFTLRRSRFSGEVNARLMVTAAASYFGVFVILLARALSGKSLLPLEASSIAMFAMWALSTAVCAWIATVRLGLPAAAETY